MNVLVNAAAAKTGGGVTYLFHLLRSLPAAAPEHRYDVYLPAPTLERLAPRLDSTRVRLHPYPYADTGGASRLRFDQLEIPRLVRRHRSHLLFSTANFGTLRSPCPQLLLLQNTLPFVESAAAEAGAPRAALSAYLRRAWTVWSMRVADRVLLPTAAMRELIAPFVELDPEVVEVLHYGIDAEGLRRPPGPPSALARELARQRAEGVSVLLNVSHYVRHKNLETVVEALPLLLERGHRVRFVTTVARNDEDDHSEDFRRFRARVDELGLQEVVLRTGPVGPGELAGLYRSADLFVFPSTTESFGFPLVEAMACGCPVAASDLPVMRELCEAGAEYFPPLDARACAETLSRLLLDPARRAELARRAEARAADFSWSDYAERFVRVMEAMAGGGAARPRAAAPPRGGARTPE